VVSSPTLDEGILPLAHHDGCGKMEVGQATELLGHWAVARLVKQRRSWCTTVTGLRAGVYED